jgi:hypothetical protein
MKTIQCPSCGAQATNLMNCEYCNSLFVRFSNLQVTPNELIEKASFYEGLEEKIKEALSLCKTNEYVNLYVKLGDKLLFQLSRSSMINNYLSGLNIGATIESLDGIGIVNIISKNEELYLQRLLNMEESLLFYQSSEPDNAFFAIDFGIDYSGATLLSSLLLNKVFRINPKSLLTYDIEAWSDNNETLIPEKKGNCFIATAAMGDYNHPVVIDLRQFRDNWLLKRNWGIRFTNWYYSYGPYAAKRIEKSNSLKVISYILIVKPLQLITKKLR